MRLALYSDILPLLLFFLAAIEACIDREDWASYSIAAAFWEHVVGSGWGGRARHANTMYECVE